MTRSRSTFVFVLPLVLILGSAATVSAVILQVVVEDIAELLARLQRRVLLVGPETPPVASQL